MVSEVVRLVRPLPTDLLDEILVDLRPLFPFPLPQRPKPGLFRENILLVETFRKTHLIYRVVELVKILLVRELLLVLDLRQPLKFLDFLLQAPARLGTLLRVLESPLTDGPSTALAQELVEFPLRRDRLRLDDLRFHLVQQVGFLALLDDIAFEIELVLEVEAAVRVHLEVRLLSDKPVNLVNRLPLHVVEDRLVLLIAEIHDLLLALLLALRDLSSQELPAKFVDLLHRLDNLLSHELQKIGYADLQK